MSIACAISVIARYANFRFGAAFLMDSGSSCGEISGHAKPINAVSVRQQRPFRAVSGGDDNSVIFHTAVPFKYDKMLSNHSRFVRDVGFSPNGDLFVSVGSDGKILLYDGKTGDVKGEVERGGATSSLLASSWNPDSSLVATAGADGVVTIWDAATQKEAQKYVVGTDVSSQQNGVVYANAHTLVSVSLSGVLNVFDTRESGSKWRKLHGPTKAVTASALADKTFYTGSFDGGVKAFEVGKGGKDDGLCVDVTGPGHTALVSALTTSSKDKIRSAGWDDKVSSIAGTEFADQSIPAKAQPAGLAATSKAVYTASSAGVDVHSLSGGAGPTISDAATAVAAFEASNGDVIAFGTGTQKVVLATVSGGDLKVEAEFEDNKGQVLSLAFSPDGALLASGDVSDLVHATTSLNQMLIIGIRPHHPHRREREENPRHFEMDVPLRKGQRSGLFAER